MVNTLLLPELREMLAEGNAQELAEFFSAVNASRAAEFMEGLTAEETWAALQHAPLADRLQVFFFLDHDKQVEIVESADRDQIVQLIEELAADDRVDILQGVDDEIEQDILQRMSADERRETIKLSAYPEGTAGAVMTTEVAKLHEKFTVIEALAELARQSEDLETIYYLFIVDERNVLQGLVSTRQLVTALSKPNTRLHDLMETELITALPLDDQEKVAEQVARYDLLAIPVVDEQRRLLGIVTHDDVIDVLREEALEDAQRLGGLEPLEHGYLNTSVLSLSWKRGIWLTVLFCASITTAFILGSYEDTLKRDDLIWLSAFVPLIISTGGNSGSQSATLIVTAMAAGTVLPRHWKKVFLRELFSGLLLGAFLALIGMIAGAFQAPTLLAAVAVPISIVLIVICATAIGGLLPLLFGKMGLEPAIMSNPFVAGIMDILGILIFVNVGIAVLSLTR